MATIRAHRSNANLMVVESPDATMVALGTEMAERKMAVVLDNGTIAVVKNQAYRFEELIRRAEKAAVDAAPVPSDIYTWTREDVNAWAYDHFNLSERGDAFVWDWNSTAGHVSRGETNFRPGSIPARILAGEMTVLQLREHYDDKIRR